ncbi:cytochrome P450 [Mycobacteroides abscessus]|uniref:cytochrome P450 n=1 Tax=Mycobacteroides abscessus TaxID=36809 RepID=UPI002105945A|nr:cytochrome P450 [Mycobacteroides abscessus]
MAGVEQQLRSFVYWILRDGPPLLARWAARATNDAAALLYLDDRERWKVRVPEVQDAVRAQGALVRTAGGRIYVSSHHGVTKEILVGDEFRSVDTTLLFPPGPLRNLYQWSTRRGFVNIIEPPSFAVMEPPEHTRYRRLVSRAFTVRAVQQMRDQVIETVQELLDNLRAEAPTRSVDLMEHYCGALPVTVIAELLGVPRRERMLLRALGDAMAPALDSGLSWRTHRQVERAGREFDMWLGEHIQRLRTDPGEDLLSRLATVSDGQDMLSEVELKATAGFLLSAGFETTVNLLGNGVKLLLDNPSQLARLHKDPQLWPNAVDEILRYDPPVTGAIRVSRRDTAVAGIPVSAGRLIVMSGGNRDPQVFTDPHIFDIARANAKDHLAFGGGRHFCIGAALARMEGEIGLRALFDAFPDIAPAQGAFRAPGRALRGWSRLPVTLGTAERRTTQR